MPALSVADLAILKGYQYPGGVNAAAVINNICDRVRLIPCCFRSFYVIVSGAQ